MMLVQIGPNLYPKHLKANVSAPKSQTCIEKEIVAPFSTPPIIDCPLHFELGGDFWNEQIL